AADGGRRRRDRSVDDAPDGEDLDPRRHPLSPDEAALSFESFVALRYLATSRRRAHVALISTISVLGLGVGVAALVLSLSLLSGFQDRIRAQMAERTPHVVVSPARGDRLADAEAVRRV